jgi:hypothetical protein
MRLSLRSFIERQAKERKGDSEDPTGRSSNFLLEDLISILAIPIAVGTQMNTEMIIDKNSL